MSIQGQELLAGTTAIGTEITDMQARVDAKVADLESRIALAEMRPDSAEAQQAIENMKSEVVRLKAYAAPNPTPGETPPGGEPPVTEVPPGGDPLAKRRR